MSPVSVLVSTVIRLLALVPLLNACSSTLSAVNVTGFVTAMSVPVTVMEWPEPRPPAVSFTPSNSVTFVTEMSPLAVKSPPTSFAVSRIRLPTPFTVTPVPTVMLSSVV